MPIPIKIILTVTNDLSYDQRMARISGSLARAGYKVELVGRILKSSLPLAPKPYQQTRLKCWFNKGKVFYIEYNLRLFWYLLFRRAAIICAIDLDTIIPCYYAARWQHSAIVYDAHEYFPYVPEVIDRPRVQQFWQWVERTFVPRMDAAYTVSASIAAIFRKHYQIPISTIRNLPDSISSPPLLRGIEGEKYILYQGALNAGRGLEQMIAAMPYIDFQLWIAGEGDLSSELKTLVIKLRLTEKVKFLGWVLPIDLKIITTKAYVGINLLENKSLSYYYSLANKFLDYVHAGLPQLAMSFPEYERINKEYEVAVLLPDLQIETIVAAISGLLADENKYAQLQENCLVCSQNLNWQYEEQTLIALYDTISQ